MLIACGALAWGWMRMAERATDSTRQCELRRNRRLAALPAIVVNQNEVRYENELLAIDGLNDDSPTFKIDALFERLQKDRKVPCNSDEVCLDNLVTLSIPVEAPPRLVRKLVNTVWAAGWDIVHVPDRDATRW